MKIDSDKKSNFLMPWNKKAIVDVDKDCIKFKNVHKFFRPTIESKFTLENDINKFCKKASQKVNTLARINN